jgi:hypothetical protein
MITIGQKFPKGDDLKSSSEAIEVVMISLRLHLDSDEPKHTANLKNHISSDLYLNLKQQLA